MNKEEKSSLLAQLQNYMVFSNFWMFLSNSLGTQLFLYYLCVGIPPITTQGIWGIKFKASFDFLLSQCQTIPSIKMANWWKRFKINTAGTYFIKCLVPSHWISLLAAGATWHLCVDLAISLPEAFGEKGSRTATPHGRGQLQDTLTVHPSQSLCLGLLQGFPSFWNLEWKTAFWKSALWFGNRPWNFSRTSLLFFDINMSYRDIQGYLLSPRFLITVWSMSQSRVASYGLERWLSSPGTKSGAGRLWPEGQIQPAACFCEASS